MKSALVVISHYNAWKTDHLIALLDQIAEIPAGHPFRCRIVVNQAQPKPLELPARFADVEVLYRENIGYNIGAWDHGWRQDPGADFYLFLQEECQLLQAGWLKAFIDPLMNPKVGLVGESLFCWGHSWERADYYWQKIVVPSRPDGSGKIRLMDAKRETLAKRQIPLGKTVQHLQSLVLASRRDVLEAVDGFMVEQTYGHAVGAEVAISKQVELLGLRIRQVGIRPFRYVVHPQWRHLGVSYRRVLFQWVEPYLPIRAGAYFHVYPRWHRQMLSRAKNAILARYYSRAKPQIKSES